MKRTCDACGAIARRSSRFCPKCGASLSAVEETIERAVPPRRDDGWSNLRSVGWMMAVLLAGGAVAFYATKLNPAAEARYDLLTSAFVGVVALAFAWRERSEIKDLLGAPRANLEEWMRAIGIALAGGLLVAIYFRALHGIGVPDLDYFEPWRDAGLPIAVPYLMYCVVAPLTEELAFRGFAQTALGRVLGPRETVAVQGALFAVVHILPFMFLSHFVLGVMFGELRRTTRSLWPGVVLHASWNAGVFLLQRYG